MQGAQPSRKRRAKGRHRRPSAVHKAAQRAGMAAPVIAVSGAMAAAPAFMTAPQVHQALAQTGLLQLIFCTLLGAGLLLSR